MPKEFDWSEGMEPPTGAAIDIPGPWDTPSAIPLDQNGDSLIPELANRNPTHNESVLIARTPIALSSSNVDEIWWNWGSEGVYDPKLFVRFLGGSLYSYNGPKASLSVAVGMVETMSPGRYVWNVLRILFPVPDSKGTGPDTYTCLIKGASKGKRKRQVVRLVSDAEHKRRSGTKGYVSHPRSGGPRTVQWKPGMGPPK
jgi:hypothetical protein